jgi:SAM-dependent methyltransferase
MTSLVEQQREHFNRIADTYYSARQHLNHRTLKDLIWSTFLSDKSSLWTSDLAVLDAMCGYADAEALVRKFIRNDIRYSGFDYSDEVVEHVRRDHPEFNVWQADATAFRPERGYDLVVLIGGLHHVHREAPRALSNLADALKPGGHFLSFEPTHGNPVTAAIRKSVYRRNSLFDAETERGFSVGELFSMFRTAGLEPVDAIYPGLLSYTLYYNPDAFPGLNVGGPKAVRRIFSLEQPFMRSALARTLSFATLSLWRKPAV